ncbi:hypothetical protein J3R30DRAFT_1221802 [Lentinula aciculospora]|uniref:Uncharacterized protein n=1 Tax=Lentinula aciculospora TaxID=153920 RepID=A0A9W9DH77_9AGAR|nr:hypothetical protein J3R30DRAFT_1221802 [Lentinula aciculospora]
MGLADEFHYEHGFENNDIDVDTESEVTYKTRIKTTKFLSCLSSPRSLRTILVVQWMIIALLAVFDVLRRGFYESPSISAPKHLFSPADDVIHYQVQEITFQHHTPYKGVGDEVDWAWAALYNYSKTVVSREKTSLLTNKPDPLYPVSALKSTHGHRNRVTSTSHNVEPVYLIELDVFSQLHCLDDIRKFVHSNEYSSSPSTDRISWCIDSLRQSLMCTADINPMVYSRNPNTEEFELSDSNAYTCRDFEAIREWAKQLQLDQVMEKEIQFSETEYW